MTVWRMSMRFGTGGPEMWEKCFRAGVAAIAYTGMEGIDLSKYAEKEPAKNWAKLSPPKRGFLRRVAYDMQKGDVIYVKQGPQIVGRGIVLGPYQFDRKGKIRCPGYPDLPFAHQVPVKWDKDFEPLDILLDSEISTVLRLDGERLQRLEQAIAQRKARTKERARRRA